MPNESKTLFHVFVKKGMSDREALFALIDHYFGLCGNVDEINRKNTEKLEKRIKTLEEELRDLRSGRPPA